jgi:hypothetical protein
MRDYASHFRISGKLDAATEMLRSRVSFDNIIKSQMTCVVSQDLVKIMENGN